MTQNMSHAVMAQRREKDAGIWARDPHDWYVESEWCSRRLFESERFLGEVHDPACGMGNIVKSAQLCGVRAIGHDIINRSRLFCSYEINFLDKDWPYPVDNFASNPPFGIADQFVSLAINRAKYKVAMLLPATWHFGSKRAAWLKTTPLRRVLALTPRPSMPPGAVIAAGQKPGGGTKDFAWYIWERGYVGPWEGGWLHRDSDYEGGVP